MSVLNYVQNGEPVDDIVSNRVIRQVITDSGLDPDANFVGFLPYVPVAYGGSLVGQAKSINFIGTSLSVSMSGDTVDVELDVEVGPGTATFIPMFDSSSTITDTPFYVEDDNLVLNGNALIFGTPATVSASGDLRVTDSFEIRGLSPNGNFDKGIMSFEVFDSTTPNHINLGVVGSTSSENGSNTRVILRRGASLHVESINGTALSTSDYIEAAGNFDNKISVSGWVFDTANNALQRRVSGGNSTLGRLGAPWGRAYV
jgi:hypothetical protein